VRHFIHLYFSGRSPYFPQLNLEFSADRFIRRGEGVWCLSSRDSAAIQAAAGSLDLLLVTVNATPDGDAFVAPLAQHGRLHVVGEVMEPIPVRALDIIMAQRSVSGSPTGSPVDITTTLNFAAHIRSHIRSSVFG